MGRHVVGRQRAGKTKRGEGIWTRTGTRGITNEGHIDRERKMTADQREGKGTDITVRVEEREMAPRAAMKPR